MRRYASVVASLSLLWLSAAAVADEVVYVDTRGDSLLKADADYLSQVQGNERQVVVTIARASDRKRIKVRAGVRGALDIAEVGSLLQLALANLGALGSKKYTLDVSVVGYKHRVAVKYGVACGMLCGSGQTLLYSGDGGSWKYLYAYEHWIS